MDLAEQVVHEEQVNSTEDKVDDNRTERVTSPVPVLSLADRSTDGTDPENDTSVSEQNSTTVAPPSSGGSYCMDACLAFHVHSFFWYISGWDLN